MTTRWRRSNASASHPAVSRSAEHPSEGLVGAARHRKRMSAISPSTQRSRDIKLLAIISAVVLLCGFFIAGTILFLTKGDAPGPCGKFNAGSLTDLVPRAAT